MADWEVYSSRNGNIYSTYFSSGSYLQQIENMVVDYDTIAADKMMSQNIDNYTTSLSDKIDAASNAGYFSDHIYSSCQNVFNKGPGMV